MDFLGLRNLTLIDNVLSDINKEKNLKYNDIPWWKKTLSIFELQWQRNISIWISRYEKFLKNLNLVLDDIVAAIALFRPGPAQNIDSYIRRSTVRKDWLYSWWLIPVLESTYGIIIYQEQ